MDFNGLNKEKISFEQDTKEIFERKFETFLKLMKGEYDKISPENRPTILDFQGVPPGSKEKDFLQWIEREINIKPEVILENKKTPESLKNYKILNYAYKQAQIFLRDILKYKNEEISVGPDSLSSKQDIFGLLNGTVLSKGMKGLSKAPLYCLLVKETIVAYETLKNDAQLLKNLTDNFENRMIAPISAAYNVEAPLVFLNESEEGKNFYVMDDNNLEGTVNSRAKDIQMAMLRYNTRPESDAETALKDGIASRIIIERNNAKELLPILCNWLIKKMGVRFLNIENKSFLSEKEMDKMKKNLLEHFSENNFNLLDGDHHSSSTGKFVTLLIKGILSRDNISNSNVSKHARAFEIQLVLPDSENEKGINHHSIYHIRRVIEARTRLKAGLCNEDVFHRLVKEASVESQIPKKQIIDYLLLPYEGKEAPIVKVKKKNGEFVYVYRSVYSRWNKIGFVDHSTYSSIKDIQNKK